MWVYFRLCLSVWVCVCLCVYVSDLSMAKENKTKQSDSQCTTGGSTLGR